MLRKLSLTLLLYTLFHYCNSQILINELMSTNGTNIIENDFYNFPDWIEIYNNGNTSVNLNTYYLSDDRNVLFKWQIPFKTLQPNKYHLIYCDKENVNNHSNFGLQSDGETIYLTSNQGLIIDSVKFPQQFPDISYGRNISNLNQWFYCATPTPGSANVTVEQKKEAPKPIFSLPAGRLNSATNVSLTGENVKYSVNGSKPHSNGMSYSYPINISSTTVLKARSFDPEYLPGKTEANTYFINEHTFTLPVVSLSFDRNFFWDNTIGIHVFGTNGLVGNCTGAANWNQNWEREAFFEFFDVNGVKQISQPVGVKISGGCSRSFADQKSLSVYARGKYGKSDFDYSFFEQKPEIRSYKTIFIRNSGNDHDKTKIWDGVMQALLNESVDIDFQSFMSSIVYLNGEYWGIMNLREKVNEDYFLANYELGRDSIDFMEGVLRSAYIDVNSVKAGSAEDYLDLLNFIESNSLSDNDNYNWVTSQLDIQEYLNYMAIQIYIANTDWPGNNIKYWKKSNNGKWRWVLYDTDFGFSQEMYNHQTIEFATETNGPDWPNPPWSTLLFRKMLENDSFRNDFAKTVLTLRNTVFHPDWCSYVVDSIAGIVDYEMSYHLNRWGGDKNGWNWNLNSFKDYATSRYNFIPDYIASYFDLSNPVDVSVSNPSRQQGDVAVNESVIENYPFNMTTYSDLGLKIEAKPISGYKFKHWKYSGSVISKLLISSGSQWSYFDKGGDYPTNWKAVSFNDANWAEGNGQLGYGDGDESTVISSQDNNNQRIPTYLFRKKITIDNPLDLSNIKLNLMADDGGVVYINGIEVYRVNMNDGVPSFSDYASANAVNEDEYLISGIANSYFVTGENVIACEIHQVSNTSSDVSFDISITYTEEMSSQDGVYSTKRVLDSDTAFAVSVEPVFEPIEQVIDVYINEVSPMTSEFRDEYGEKTGFIELYNSSVSPLSLNGFYISDKKSNLIRYEIPQSTLIDGNGFAVFYADRQAKQGDKHMSFRAGEGGETFYLSQKVGGELHILDSLEYRILVDGYSYGRYTDGIGDKQYMANITPGEANDPKKPTISEVQTLALNSNILLYPNPSKGVLNVELKNEYYLSDNYQLDIMDMSGRVVYPKVLLNSSNNSINIYSLKYGIYFTRIYKAGILVKTEKLIVIQ